MVATEPRSALSKRPSEKKHLETSGYVVIRRHSVLWAGSIVTRFAEGQQIDPRETADLLRELDRFDPLDVIAGEILFPYTNTLNKTPPGRVWETHYRRKKA